MIVVFHRIVAKLCHVYQLIYIIFAYLVCVNCIPIQPTSDPPASKINNIIDEFARLFEAWNIQLKVDFIDTTADCLRVLELSFISLKYLKRL